MPTMQNRDKFLSSKAPHPGDLILIYAFNGLILTVPKSGVLSVAGSLSPSVLEIVLSCWVTSFLPRPGRASFLLTVSDGVWPMSPTLGQNELATDDV